MNRTGNVGAVVVVRDDFRPRTCVRPLRVHGDGRRSRIALRRSTIPGGTSTPRRRRLLIRDKRKKTTDETREGILGDDDDDELDGRSRAAGDSCVARDGGK